MTEPKFTPGPWLVRANEPWVIAKNYGDMKSVFHVNHPAEPSKTQMANAHLIAAAPDLYHALSDLLEQCRQYGHMDEIRAAEIALAKARGEG